MIFKICFLLIFSTLLFSESLVTPIPQNLKYNSPKANLGKKLFFDKLLSKEKKISCSSCHNLLEGGSDKVAGSLKHDGTRTKLNAPTVFNAIYNFRYFWDGRAKNPKIQIYNLLINPHFMNHSKNSLEKAINSKYKLEFKKIYNSSANIENITDALVEFQKALITPNSRFDQFLRGQKSALTYDEKKGYNLFISSGCIACHNGVNLGGNTYSKLRLNDKKEFNYLGKYNHTQKEKDKYLVKVPTLRNIMLTSPYFHDGSIPTIEEAIKSVTHSALHKDLDSEKINYLVLFLNTLTGEKPKILQTMRVK